MLPVRFQDLIREEYPLFSTTIEQQQQISIVHEDDNILPQPRIIQSDQMKNYRFSSENQDWKINLTSTFLSLSTSRYSTWRDFKARLQKPLTALIKCYKPAFYERIGLRYVDVFTCSKLGLIATPWKDLIKPFALGFLSNNDVMTEVRAYNCITELDIGENALARINTMLGYPREKVIQAELRDQELSFILDSDMFFGKRNTGQIWDSLEYLHDSSSKLLRAIITDKLHEAMEPIPYESDN